MNQLLIYKKEYLILNQIELHQIIDEKIATNKDIIQNLFIKFFLFFTSLNILTDLKVSKRTVPEIKIAKGIRNSVIFVGLYYVYVVHHISHYSLNIKN